MDLRNQSPRWRAVESAAGIGLLATLFAVGAALGVRIVTHGPLAPAFPSVAIAIEVAVAVGIWSATMRERYRTAIVLAVVFVLSAIAAVMANSVLNPPI